MIAIAASSASATPPALPADTAPPAPHAAPVVPTPAKEWPFSAWDRAEAFAFNQIPYGPGIPLRVYDAAHGWNPNIVDHKPIDSTQAKRAIEWVKATTGEVEVSGCPFPRHAIVWYAGDTPVGTANLGFDCGDILVWPDFERHAAGTAPKVSGKAYKDKLAAYDYIFPLWKKFFGEELGISTTWTPSR